jgi:hypothetical protein
LGLGRPAGRGILRPGESYGRFALEAAGFIEGPAFFAILVHMLTGRPLALCVLVFAVFLFVVQWPSAT